MAPSFSCLPGCNGSTKHPPSPEGEPSRLADVPILPEIPKTSPFKRRKQIPKQELQRKKTAKLKGPASWSTASRLSRPEDMAEFRAIFEDAAFLGQEQPQISPTATLPPMTAVSSIHPIAEQSANTHTEQAKPSIELLTLPPELEKKQSSHSLAQALKVKLSFSKIRKQLSRESARLSSHSGKKSSRQGTGTGSSEEEIERRAELRRIRKMRIQEELEREGFDSDAKSIGTLATTRVGSAKNRVAEMREHLKGSGSVDLMSFEDFSRGGFEWTPGKLSTHAIFAISGRESNAVITPGTPLSPKLMSDTTIDEPVIGTAERMRRHSTPAQILPALDIEFYTPTHPNRDSTSIGELPPAPVIYPVKLPSIADETARRTSWRLSYASERRASHLRSLSASAQGHKKSLSLSQGHEPTLPIGQEIHPVKPTPSLYEMPTAAPLRSWLHSQGLRIPSEVIDDTSSEDESGSPSAKRRGKRKGLSHEELCSDLRDFGGVDGSREHSPVLHLHEMGISQRLASRGLISSTSSPQLSVCGSRFGGGHRRGISAISSAAGSRYGNFSPYNYSARSKYDRQQSINESKNSRSQSDSNAPYSARSRHQGQPNEDSSKSGQNSSDQTGFAGVNIPEDWESLTRGVDGSSSIYHTPMESKNTPLLVPSRTSSARNSPQNGSKYKIDQILHTGMTRHSLERNEHSHNADRVDPDERDRVDLDIVFPDGKVSQSFDFPMRSLSADSTSMATIPLDSSAMSKPVVRWMGIRSTLDDIPPVEADTQILNKKEAGIARAIRRFTHNDSSLLASETQSFMEREKELMEIQKRFTMPGGEGDPKEPVQSKFKEEFEKPSLSFHRSFSRPHSFLSKIGFHKKKNGPNIDSHSSEEGTKMESIDGADDVTPTSPGGYALSPGGYASTPGDYPASPGVYERSNPFDKLDNGVEDFIEMAPPQRPGLRGPRAGGRPGGKAPKAAPAMAPAMEPTKGQKKKAMREKLASWEDELAAVEKAAREKSKGVAPPKRRRRRDDWDPIKWSSFPSHDRHERSESANSADHVDQKDFAVKARTPSGNVGEWQHSERKHILQHHEQHHVTLSMREKISLSLRNSLLKIRATEAAFENDAANGRRSSISAGGELEFPELEIVIGTESSGNFEKIEAEVEEALRIEEEMKASERKRQEAATKRALMQAPSPVTDGSFDGSFRSWGEQERGMEHGKLLGDSIPVANPHFYDDCVFVSPIGRDGECSDDAASSTRSARTTGSLQLEMEKGNTKEKERVDPFIGELRRNEKYGTWNGRGGRKKKSTVQTVYGFKTKKIVVGRGGRGDGVAGRGGSSEEGTLRRSTVEFQRDVEMAERLEMERVLNAAKAAWGVSSEG